MTKNDEFDLSVETDLQTFLDYLIKRKKYFEQESCGFCDHGLIRKHFEHRINDLISMIAMYEQLFGKYMHTKQKETKKKYAR